ncbi:MAG: cytochrome P450 [Myxococcota bacterium]|nr:cytochrome P450 [Myxococcota bacterium]
MRAPPYSSDPAELFAADTIEDPYPLFERLRNERPLSRVAETGVHIVASWDLIEAALARERDFSANVTGMLVLGEDGVPSTVDFSRAAATQVIATADEPHHAVHRSVAQPRLAAALIRELEEPVREWAVEAVDAWHTAGGGDFMSVAEVVPARAVAHILGLPDGDVSRYRQWAMMGGDMLAGAVTPERIAAFAAEGARMNEYLDDHLARAGAAKAPAEPLLRALSWAVDEDRIDARHAVGIAIVMFGAGGESTAALIGSVVHRLAAEPPLADRLRADATLVPRFVEEVARLEPPFKFHYRAVRRDCELGGFSLAPGDRLMLLWASANRDTAHIDAADELQLDRRHPKQHLGFGRGAHFCIGAPLARLEARVVCEELLARTERISLVRGAAPVWAPSIFVRRLEHLPLAAG